MKSIDEFVKNLSVFFAKDSVPRLLVRVESELHRREIISKLLKIVENANPYYDTFEVGTEENISIDTVRKIKSFLLYPPSSTLRKYVIIDEMSLLTLEASSAMLKIVEEPPSYAAFLGFSSNLESIFSTLKSRFFVFNTGVSLEELIGTLNLSSREIDFLKSNPDLVTLYKKNPDDVKNMIETIENDPLNAFSVLNDKNAFPAIFEHIFLNVNLKNLAEYFERLSFILKDESSQISLLFDCALTICEDLLVFNYTNSWKSLKRKSYLNYYLKMKPPLKEFVERISRIRRENVSKDLEIFWILLNFAMLKKV